MVPSPLCGNLVTFVSLISKTRIKTNSLHEIAEAEASAALKVFIDLVCASITKAHMFQQFSFVSLVCFTHALMFARASRGISFYKGSSEQHWYIHYWSQSRCVALLSYVFFQLSLLGHTFWSLREVQ